jgi:hypothetical protein
MPESNWQALYTAALTESDPARLIAKIEAARRAIHQRLKIVEDSDNNRECEKLDRALHALFTLAARKRSA